MHSTAESEGRELHYDSNYEYEQTVWDGCEAQNLADMIVHVVTQMYDQSAILLSGWRAVCGALISPSRFW